MASFEDATAAVKKSLQTKENRIEWQPGYMGDGTGQVRTSKANHYWVRYPFENSPAAPVYGVGNFPIVEGVRVVVGYLPWQPGQFQIICQSDSRLSVVNPADTPVSAGYGIGYVPLADHAINHMYLGTDPVYVNWRQIQPLGVFPTDPASLSVTISQGYIPRPGADIFVYEQTLDLTSHVPGSGARYVLISYNSAGAAAVTDGTINTGGFAALTFADIPDTPAGNWRSCAVVLYAGQTAIVETRSEIDFLDLRFPEESGAGSVSPSNIPLANTHILVGNGSGVAADVALSNDATLANTGALTLATVNSTVGTFGDASNVPQVTVNAKGLVTAIANIPIVFPASAISAYNETQTGDGSTTIFYLANYALPGTIRVYINGILQPVTDDTAPSDVITFTSAPAAGALITFSYDMEII